jgi:hypothetical protein
MKKLYSLSLSVLIITTYSCGMDKLDKDRFERRKEFVRNGVLKISFDGMDDDQVEEMRSLIVATAIASIHKAFVSAWHAILGELTDKNNTQSNLLVNFAKKAIENTTLTKNDEQNKKIFDALKCNLFLEMENEAYRMGGDRFRNFFVEEFDWKIEISIDKAFSYKR